MARRSVSACSRRRGYPHSRGAPPGRAGWTRRRQAAHRPQPQRPGGHRSALVAAQPGGRAGRAASRADPGRSGAGRGRDRRADARLHPPAAGPADPLVALAAQPRLGLAAGPGAPGRFAPAAQPLPVGRGRAGRQSLRRRPPRPGCGPGLRRPDPQFDRCCARSGLRSGVPELGCLAGQRISARSPRI